MAAEFMLVISITCTFVTLIICYYKQNLTKESYLHWGYTERVSFGEQLTPFFLILLEIIALSPLLLLLATDTISLSASHHRWNNCSQLVFTFEPSCFCSRLEDFTCSKLASLSIYTKEVRKHTISSDNFYLSYAIRLSQLWELYCSKKTSATHHDVFHSLGGFRS